jgi:peptide/nickel transport system substrate-binding protein
MFADNWTLDPSIYQYNTAFRPNDYVAGSLAQSWEFTDPSTFVVHLRQGIYWQNIAPVNGRQFVAKDVEQHYCRMYGLGDGYTTNSPGHSRSGIIAYLQSVTATDKFTVVFKWTMSNPQVIEESMEAQSADTPDIEAPEAVAQWGNLNDWHHAIGTGPFILSDFVDGSSATLVANPNYWGTDERYPGNKLPYIQQIRYLVITDDATALSGLRTGKIDAVDGVSLQNANALQKSNSYLVQQSIPANSARTIDPRVDIAPFNNLKVREAMQMAINLPQLASGYYLGSADPSPSTLTSNYETGWGYPYSQWTQDEKSQYAFNPTAAKALLADAGYPTGFTTTIVADNAGDLDLLEAVKSYFADVNIIMNIQTMDSAQWNSYVLSGVKQTALAYRSTGALGFTFEPSFQLQYYLTGHPNSNYQKISDPVIDAAFPNAMTASKVDDYKKILTAVDKEIVDQHFIISLLQPKTYDIWQPWLKGFNGQDQAIGGTGSGPHLNGFYFARFWIDSNQKKSMGY